MGLPFDSRGLIRKCWTGKGVPMNLELIVPPKPPAPKIDIDPLRKSLRTTTDINEIIEIAARVDAFDESMENCGLYPSEDMRPINETRMEARWKLGQALAQIERGKPGPRKDN